VGVWQNDRVEIIANDQGNRTTPSYVAFTDTERLIGDAAKNQVAMNPRNTVFDAKRLIGRKFSEPAVQEDMRHFSFTVKVRLVAFLAWGSLGCASAAHSAAITFCVQASSSAMPAA